MLIKLFPMVCINSAVYIDAFCAMDGAKLLINYCRGKLAANGRLPATLPEPIERDRV
jgi:hypothetical protein